MKTLMDCPRTITCGCRVTQTGGYVRTETLFGGPGSFTSNAAALCPDLLRYEQIGDADNWRGRVVRGFFWLMRVWPA